MTVSMIFVSFKSEASLCHAKTACHVHMRSPTVSSVVSPMVCAMVSAQWCAQWWRNAAKRVRTATGARVGPPGQGSVAS
eukprot:836175-Prymnesium_polylepis.1